VAKALSGKALDNASLIKKCDMVFLGVKPQVLPALLSEIAPLVKEREGNLTLITMAAGVKIAALLSKLGEKTPVIRIMPNTPVMVGEGVIVYCSENVSEDGEKAFAALLASGGLVEKIEEEKIDAASALHGCGPAFAYLFVEALADGAVSCGLSREAALRFASKTVKGASEMILKTGKHPGELKDAVCSPGGSTIEGVRTLEEGGFRGIAMDAVLASYEKTLELGK
jgi:pyrroline-5-carboxylate reductase